jgi:hypothetical protein
VFDLSQLKSEGDGDIDHAIDVTLVVRLEHGDCAEDIFANDSDLMPIKFDCSSRFQVA